MHYRATRVSECKLTERYNVTVNTVTGEIIPLGKIDDAMLAEIQSFDDALAIINSVFDGHIIEADKVMGTGFGLADDKAAFIGVPFVIMKSEQNASDKGEKGRFWSLHIVSKDGRKAIVNDGGTGIADQMDALADRHADLFANVSQNDGGLKLALVRPMLVKKGLRMSNYVHPTAGPSVTFYLDTSGLV